MHRFVLCKCSLSRAITACTSLIARRNKCRVGAMITKSSI